MIPIDLSGRNIIVTGGTRGIGRAISLTLARAGARVAAIYRSDEAAAQRTLADLLKSSDGHFTIQADIAVEAEAAWAIRLAEERFNGALDGLVLDAAAGAGGPLCGMATADWLRPFEVNVHGAFYCVRAAGPLLRSGASVVFISSGAGHDPLEGLSAYGASKAAVNQLAAVLAQELGPAGVRVNVVSPGSTHTGDTDPNAHPDALDERQRATIESTALRRLGLAQDVANTVLYFMSDLSGFVTGQWLRVNGGRL